MQTEAAVLFEINQPLRLVPLSIPELKRGQVLVELAYSGVCQSQLNEVEGHRGPDPYLPHTLGHEGSGQVIKVGEGVMKVNPGDAVVLSWIKGSGVEAGGSIYQKDGIAIQSGSLSTFIRQAVVSENRITPISKKTPLREASLLGCAVPTGAGIIRNTAKVSKGSSVAIFGLGGIGLSAILAAAHAGAKTLIAVDLLSSKLDQARLLGATHTINACQEDPQKEILKMTEARGVDYAVECAGKRETMEAAFLSVRDNGGLCVLAGNLPLGEKISIDPFHLIKGKRIIGTWGGETDPDRDIPFYEKEFLAGRLKLEALITHEYPLARINEALEDLKRGKVGRALINLKA